MRCFHAKKRHRVASRTGPTATVLYAPSLAIPVHVPAWRATRNQTGKFAAVHLHFHNSDLADALGRSDFRNRSTHFFGGYSLPNSFMAAAIRSFVQYPLGSKICVFG